MKREILFKAQRADGKGWVEGDLLWNNGNPIIVLQEKRDYISKTLVSEPNVGSGHHWAISTPAYRVKPETICMYSGELGSEFNGWHKGVFEGDEVTIHEFDAWGNDYETSGIIKQENGCFFLTEPKGQLRFYLEDCDRIALFLMDIHEESITVHGNIQDKTESK